MAKNKKADKKEKPAKGEKTNLVKKAKKEKEGSGKKEKKEKAGSKKKTGNKTTKTSKSQSQKAEAKAKKEGLRLAGKKHLEQAIEKLTVAFSDLKPVLGDKKFEKTIQKAGKILSGAEAKKK